VCRLFASVKPDSEGGHGKAFPMSLTVFLAVIGAALLHATWNALLKGGSDKTLGMVAVSVGHIPVAVVSLFFVPMPAPESYPYILAGTLLHLGYQVFLLNSYRIGDLTQVYPIARGSAPLIVALVSVAGLGVAFEGVEILAILVIVAGIMSVGLIRQSDGGRNGKAALLALITGTFIAGYSLVDGLGARVAGTSLGYFSWVAIGTAILMVAYTRAGAQDVFDRGQRVLYRLCHRHLGLYPSADCLGHGPARDQHRLCLADWRCRAERTADPPQTARHGATLGG